MITGGYIPFQMIFNQIGMPFEQTKFLVLSFVWNISLNLILIPIVGIYGAALAVFSSFIFQVIYMKIRLNKLTKIKI